jgi:hypothetical protein
MSTAEAPSIQQLSREVWKKVPVLRNALTIHRNHRGQKLDLNRYPSMKALYTDTRPYGAVMKSVQGGISEWLLVKGIAEVLEGRNLFWVLPDGGLVGRFVKERFNKTMANTPEYHTQQTKSGRYRFDQTISMKQFGEGTIVFAGSRSQAAFTEYVADTLFIDELDRCDQKNVAMAQDRYGFAEDPHDWRISNPTITGFAIDDEYSRSSKGRWHIRCPKCGKLVFPDPFEVLLRQVDESQYVVRDPDFEWEGSGDPNLICSYCQGILPRYGEGQWIEEFPRKRIAGYHFSKLFTSNSSLRSVLEDFNRGLLDTTIMMRVYNADFGMAYDAPGARITKAVLDAARREYTMHVPNARCIMGVDVGRVMNVCVGQMIQTDHGYGVRLVWAGTVREEKEILEVYDRYRCIAGVVDGLPEERMSRRIARQRGGMFRAYYNRGRHDAVDKNRKIVTQNRTTALDAVKEGLAWGDILLPNNIETVFNFYEQMMASTRIYDEERDEYIWEEGSKEDHYHHAMAYMLAAKKLLVSAL